jgi:hypothetical protein
MPRIFIGSSAEGLPVARAIRSNLDRDGELTLWSEGVFRLSRHSLESLCDALNATDFGVFVFTADDITVLRGEERRSVRDNVILELGMSIGCVGRLRTFIVQPREANFRLPTDLLGITVATYDAGLAFGVRSCFATSCLLRQSGTVAGGGSWHCDGPPSTCGGASGRHHGANNRSTMRVCRLGPVALHRANTDSGTRSEIACLRLPSTGRPRVLPWFMGSDCFRGHPASEPGAASAWWSWGY